MSEKQLNPEFEGTHNSAVHSSGDYCVNVAVNHGTINYVVQQIKQERFKALKQLPRDILNFVGRSEQLTEVEGVLRQGNGATIAISALSGMGGVGKSALAIRVAHRLKDDYPDAQLYVNLQGADRINCRDPFSVLGELLVELGLDEKLVVTMNLESRSKWWRSLLAELRAIVVLDNARDAAQVWQLLPGSDGPCAVIVTSRQELALDGVARLRSHIQILIRQQYLMLFSKSRQPIALHLQSLDRLPQRHLRSLPQQRPHNLDCQRQTPTILNHLRRNVQLHRIKRSFTHHRQQQPRIFNRHSSQSQPRHIIQS